MNVIEKRTLYFVDSGPQNSEKVLEAVKDRIASGDIGAVVVASTSGETGWNSQKDSKERPQLSLSHTEK